MCHGDSGSPAIIRRNDNDYLIGIAFGAQEKCGKKLMVSYKGLPKKSVFPSKYVAIPGKFMKWLLMKLRKDIKKPPKGHHQKVTSFCQKVTETKESEML